MTDGLIELARSFTLTSIYGLLFSGLLAAVSTLLCRRFGWIKQWRAYWSTLLFVCVAFAFIGFLPLQSVGFTPTALHELSFAYLSSDATPNPLSHDAKPTNTLPWQDVPSISWLVIYVLGTVFALVKCAFRFKATKKLVNNASPIADFNEHRFKKRLTLLRKFSDRYDLSIRITDKPISPFIVQWPNSHLVLSQFALKDMSDTEFTLMLRHELNHIKRSDGRLTFLMQWVMCFFWFNPILKRIAQQWMWAVETNCDRAVLTRHPNLRRTYAQAMLKVLRNTATDDANHAVAAFSSKHHRSITMRMTHIMSPSNSRIKPQVKTATLLAFAATAMTFALTFHPAVHANQMMAPGKMHHPLPQARLTAKFGIKSKIHKNHKGVDLAARMNTPVLAAAYGKVITAKEVLQGFENYGTVVVIDHGHGVKSLYSHLNTLEVAEGDWVAPGQMVARVGTTGRSTGPHLHFEVLKDGERVDPADYFELESQ